jgi:hypothetical protein
LVRMTHFISLAVAYVVADFGMELSAGTRCCP